MANEVGPKDKRPNEVGPKDKKNHPMKSCCGGGVFCPSLGACVFGASSSPSVLGFSKSPPSQAGARLSFAG